MALGLLLFFLHFTMPSPLKSKAWILFLKLHIKIKSQPNKMQIAKQEAKQQASQGWHVYLINFKTHLRRKLTAGYLPPPNIGIFDPTNMWISSKVHKILRTKSFLSPFVKRKKLVYKSLV